MGEHDKLLGWREDIANLNASASGRPERAGQVIGEFDGDAMFDDRRAQRCGLAAGIAGCLGRLREWFALGLRDILSRDSATWSRRHRLTSRATEQADYRVLLK
jgi:hypothetical protein